ncbi:MAG: ATP-binding protein, partial [Lentisphaeria bacterium]
WVVLGKLHPDGKLYSRYEWASSDELLLKSQNMKERWQKTLNKSIDTLRKYQIYKGYAGDDEGQEEALPSKSGIEMTEMNKKISYVIVPIFVEKKLWGALFVSFVTNIIEFNEISDRLLFTWADFWSIMVMNERQKKALLKADYEQKLFFENVHIPLWLHDASGKLLQYNSAVYDFFDIDHQPLTTKKNYELLTNAFAADADSAVEIIPTNEKSSARNISIANRKYILYNESLFDKKGTLIYVLKSAIDMTEQNKLFVRQSAMRDTLEALLKERDIKVAIRKATQILGKLLGVNCVFLFQFDAEQKTMSSFVENVTDEDSICFERAKNIPFAGVSFWVERLKKQSVFCINDLQNEPVERYGAYWEEIVKKRNISTVYVCGIRVESKLWGCLGVMSQGKVSFLDKDSLEFLTAFMGFIDAILEQNNTRMRLKKALDVATNANRAQSYFWSSVSHEIRTPLNSIIGFSELLSSGVSDPAIIKEYVDSISYSGNALLELVNDVLDLSKLEAKRMDVVLEPVCMAQICKDVMSIFNYAAIEKKIKLICDIPEMPKLMLDRSRIRQILVNLIGNAVKFTDKGSVTLRVEYEAKKNAMVNLSIAVIDTGIGVSEKDQKQLTKPFVQLSHLRGTNSENKGTGLGLAITKRMLKIMNGNLEIESTPGKGSCFRALLNSVKLASVFQGPVLGRCPIITKLPSPLSEIEKLSILIVDDVTMNLKVLEAILRKVGVEKIIKAGSGIEALAQLEKEEPSVVFTDMWMPEMSGEDLVKKMRLDPRWKRIPVYALTADIETTKTFNMDCFAGVLLKPVTLKQLTSVLQLLAKEL